VSVTPGTILKTAAKITVDTFVTLGDIMSDPASAHDYCDAVGVPPFPDGEWSATVAELRAKADAADDPEQWAEIINLGAKVINGLQKAIGGSAPGAPGALESAIVKVVVPVALEVSRKVSPTLHTLLALAFFTDQRLQDSFPEGLFAERWYRVLGSLASAAGWGHADQTDPETTVVDWAPIVSDAAAVAITVLAVVFDNQGFKDHLVRFWYGFDHPPIPDQEHARELAQHTFTVLLDDGSTRITEADYDAGIRPQPAAQPSAPFGITLVPIPQRADAPSRLFVQGHGAAHIDEPIGGGFHFTLTSGATFGVLASRDGLEETGDVSFQAELVRQWITQPSTSQDAIDVHAAKLAVGAAVNVDGPRAWLRVEKAELAVTGGSWLDDFVPEMRLSFDATAEASVQDGVRFKGGVGGDVLIPVNQRIPILLGSVRIEAVHLKAVLGSVDGEFAFGIEATANLTLELLSVITLHADGLGARFTVGQAADGNGNVAGIGKAGWSPAFPKGAGLDINILDRIVGGGALVYDEAAQRLGGAFKLVLADRFVLSALGIYQRATDTSPRSWLLLASLQAAQTGPGFTVRGIGLLYGSNRTTDPDAFLAGIATGDLDAVLFPDDPIGKASQYLAALERLFPTKQDAAVAGLSVQFSALDGRITFDLGVILDFQGSSLVRVYLVAQFVGLTRAPDLGERVDPASQAVYVLADGVAIYDTRTDELNVRIALRNSHVWKGELTGGASVFHGSPQVDGGGRGTYVSIGGFHPDYVPPGTKIFVPPRLSLVLGKGDHLKLQVTAYLAYTPCSIQFGFSGRLDARLYGFGIRGSLSLDVLAGFDGQFSVDVAFSVELMVGSHSLAAVAFSGSIVGLSPTILSGKASVSFLFFSISVRGSLTIHEDDLPDPSIDITGTVLSAISTPANWDPGGTAGVKLVDRQRDGVWMSPTAPLRMSQPVVPLDVPIERYGPQRLAGPQTFSVEQVTVGSATPGHTPVTGEFALGMYLDLSREEQLSARGYEVRNAGFELSRPLVAGTSVDTSDDYEEIVLDPLKRTDEPMVLTFPIRAVFLDVQLAPATLQVQGERYAVVDPAMQPQAAAMGYFEARAAARSTGLGIVAEYEVAQ
jgi:hypothetical protein